jgi:hypothetical protein
MLATAERASAEIMAFIEQKICLRAVHLASAR